jgi:mRNA interferase HicA
MKLAELERHLRQQGCDFLREGGARSVWLNPRSGRIPSVPRHGEIKDGTARAICGQREIRQR